MKIILLIITALLPAVVTAQDNCTGPSQNNQPHGLWQCHSPAGQLKMEVNYNEGIIQGVLKEYHDNGQLRLEANYTDGKLNGSIREYYSSGQLKYEGAYNNGIPVGIHKEYESNGQLKSQHDFGG